MNDVDTLALILNVRSQGIDLRIKADCQDWMLSRCKKENETLKGEKQALEVKLHQCSLREAKLSAEAEVRRDSDKRLQTENDRLRAENDKLRAENIDERSKRQKLRGAYSNLNRSIGQDCDDSIKNALYDLQMGLMG
jgi:hypothetical protein